MDFNNAPRVTPALQTQLSKLSTEQLDSLIDHLDDEMITAATLSGFLTGETILLTSLPEVRINQILTNLDADSEIPHSD